MLKTIVTLFLALTTVSASAQTDTSGRWEAWSHNNVLWKLDLATLEVNRQTGLASAWVMSTPPAQPGEPDFFVMRLTVECTTDRYTVEQMAGFVRGKGHEEIDVPREGLKDTTPGSPFTEVVSRVCR